MPPPGEEGWLRLEGVAAAAIAAAKLLQSCPTLRDPIDGSLVREAFVGVLVGGAGFLLPGVQ